MDWLNCPVCDAALRGTPDACPGCRLVLRGEAATDYLAVLDELIRVERRRGELLRLRAEALAGMRAATAAAKVSASGTAPVPVAEPAPTATKKPAAAMPAAKAAAGTGTGAEARAGAERGAAGVPRRDLSHRAVQNLLLLLGGTMLSIAAVVFTLVSWQVPALRALILVVFTLAVLAAPWLLARRRLVATAETVALLGLVLIPLDVVAVMQVFDDGRPSSGTGMDPLWGYALSAAGLSVVWALYAWRAPLRLPTPVAIVLVQTPLPLAALAIERGSATAPPAGPGSAAGLVVEPGSVVGAVIGGGLVAGAGWFAGALVVMAAFDLALWRGAGRARQVRAAARQVPSAEYVTSAVAGALAWAAGTGLAAFATVAGSIAPMPAMALVLGPASVVAILWAAAIQGRGARLLIAACAAIAASRACSAIPALIVPVSWQVAVVAGSGLLVLAAAFVLPVRLRDGVRAGGGLVLGVAALLQAYAVLEVVLGPVGWITAVWDGHTGRASEMLIPGVPWHDTGATPVVMAAAAVGVVLVPAQGDLWTAGLRRTLCLVFGSLALLMAPVSAGMPYEVALAVLVALAGALLWTAARAHERGGYAAPLWLGVYLAVLAVCWGLADRQAGGAVAGGLLVVLAACAVAGRPRAVQAVGGAGATVAAGLLAWALFGEGMAAALALLGVRAATLVVTRPSRKVAAAVVRARSTGTTVAIGSLDRLTRLVRPGGRAAVEAAAVVVGLFALSRQPLTAGEPALLLAIGALLAAASAWRRPTGPWRTVAAVEACVLAGLAPLPLSGAVVPALVGPYGWLTHAWAGAAQGAREALTPTGAWQVQPMLLPVLVSAAVAAALAAWARWGRPAAMGVAGIAFPLAATTLPVVADLPYWMALAFLVVLTAGLALWSAVSRSAAGGASLWTATLAVSWSLADRTATIAVLAAIVVTGLLCAVKGKGSPVTSVAATVTGLAVGAESVAAALGGGLGESDTALVLLLVLVLLSRAATLPGLPGAVAGPLGGAALALWPVAMALAQDGARLTLVLAVGALALAAAAGRLSEGFRQVGYMIATVASVAAIVPHLGIWVEVVGFPLDGIDRPWSERFRGWEPPLLKEDWVVEDGIMVGFWFERPAAATALGVGMFVVVTAVIMTRRLLGAVPARSMATVVVPLCLLIVPPVADLAYPWLLAFYGVVLVALAVQAATGTRARAVGNRAGAAAVAQAGASGARAGVAGARAGVAGARAGAAGVMALVFAGLTVAWGLDVAAYTPVVLGGVAVLGVVVAVVARDEAMQAVAAATGAVAAGGLAAALALSAGQRVEQAAFAVLAVAALAILTAAAPTALASARSTASEVPAPVSARPSASEVTTSQVIKPSPMAAVGAEVAGWGLAVTGVVMAGADLDLLNLALACVGVLALAVALRRDRRPAVWAGLGLLQVALWLRLGLSGVSAPEAYTVTLSAAGLIAAWTARRRDPEISSWAGYGLALALTFLPSVYAAWNDPGLTRPLLLGVAAFAATLSGAWARLQAPLILGGAVLVVTAAHEFAPALAELVGQGPRWLPIAVAGAVLLFTGATYEHRLRDLRKIHRLIVRMR